MLSRLSRLSSYIQPPPIASLTVFPNPPFRHLNSVMSPTTFTSSPPKGRLFQTAACLIIGDEVLNGKTIDTNSPFLAKYLFNLGIPLQRIETIPDSAPDITSSILRLSSTHDFVVTSGGIGPTHDDITYSSIAAAYNLPLKLHQPTVERMKALDIKRMKKEGETEQDWDTPSAQLSARLRMATLPVGEGVEYLFVDEELWVPIVVVNHNIHILPGIPKLFRCLLENLTPVMFERGRISPQTMKSHRIIISTPLPESGVAEFLTGLQERVEDKGVKVGSYPRWEKKRNTVTLVGRDLAFLESLVEEVERGVNGVRVRVEGEDDSDVEDGGVGRKSEVVREAGEKLERIESREEEEAVERKGKGREREKGDGEEGGMKR